MSEQKLKDNETKNRKKFSLGHGTYGITWNDIDRKCQKEADMILLGLITVFQRQLTPSRIIFLQEWQWCFSGTRETKLNTGAEIEKKEIHSRERLRIQRHHMNS